MKKDQLIKIIQEEVASAIVNEKSKLVNETYDLDQVKYSPAVRKQVDKLVEELQKANLSKTAVASILNDIVMGLGMNRTQLTMYMNMIKVQRQKYNF
jgi:hypothetical protein